ncbi:hypothetical protein C7974DRAFT_228010 [Boeremia exigua]|uniref:uncharacterized protein n=1 Tax=Boeremia exigua TaxID=749465 RepID=UPI001E8CAE8B|nr:uncharacterized protein C7974DRAFT_228010 [Boeremia exigua]KAH6620205.1 hypothetical protein C7974DRAFT_228010 [Boeremia exigua]
MHNILYLRFCIVIIACIQSIPQTADSAMRISLHRVVRPATTRQPFRDLINTSSSQIRRLLRLPNSRAVGKPTWMGFGGSRRHWQVRKDNHSSISGLPRTTPCI